MSMYMDELTRSCANNRPLTRNAIINYYYFLLHTILEIDLIIAHTHIYYILYRIEINQIKCSSCMYLMNVNF
jgi:hypothetical protein